MIGDYSAGPQPAPKTSYFFGKSPGFSKNVVVFFDRTVDRQKTKLERERDGIGKGPRAGTRTQDGRSATALHVDALPIRLSVPTKNVYFYLYN